jgi:hypothetical protein
MWPIIAAVLAVITASPARARDDNIQGMIKEKFWFADAAPRAALCSRRALRLRRERLREPRSGTSEAHSGQPAPGRAPRK